MPTLPAPLRCAWCGELLPACSPVTCIGPPPPIGVAGPVGARRGAAGSTEPDLYADALDRLDRR